MLLHIKDLFYGKQLHTVHLVRISKIIAGNMNIFIFYVLSQSYRTFWLKVIHDPCSVFHLAVKEETSEALSIVRGNRRFTRDSSTYSTPTPTNPPRTDTHSPEGILISWSRSSENRHRAKVWTVYGVVQEISSPIKKKKLSILTTDVLYTTHAV